MRLPKSLITVTPFSKFIALFLFILFPFAGFYVGENYQKTVDNSGVYISPTIIPTVFPNNTPYQKVTTNPSLINITKQDDGKTINVYVGDNIFVDLGTDQNWQITTIDPMGILQNSRLMIAERIGTKRFVVGKAGTAQITATGTAKCAKGQMCPMYAILFKVTIVAK